MRRLYAIVCLLYLCLMTLGAQSYSFKYEHINVAQFIDSLKKYAHVDVAYDVNALPPAPYSLIKYDRLTPVQMLEQLLANEPIEIVELDGQIIIRSSRSIQQKYVRISGTITDRETSDPLPMVNISLKNHPIGTVTNELGEFELVLPDYLTRDTLAFLSMGFATEFCYHLKTDTLIELKMSKTAINLAEIEVKAENVNDIIQKVITHQSQNYPTESNILSAFFRESIKKDGSYINVSEAIIEVMKGPYDALHQVEKVKFIKGRKQSLDTTKLVNFKLEGGPFYFSRIDVARYLDFLPLDDNPIYNYTYKGLDVLNDEFVYRIAFVPVLDDGALNYKGELFVHTHSYALVKATFELTKKALKQSRKTFIQKETKGLKARPLQARYVVDYRPYQGRWMLNKVRGELMIHIIDRKQNINSKFEAVTEMLISNIKENKGERFRLSEVYKSNYILADEITETDEQFWDNYNIIKPNEDLSRVFKKERKK